MYVFLQVRPSGPPILSIIGWCCSIPRKAAWLISRLCPLNLVCYYSCPMMVLVPPPPLIPPSKIHPGYLPPAVRPFPLSFYFSLCLLSVRVSQSALPSKQRLITRRPSGGLLRWTVDQWYLLGPSAPYAGLFPTCAAGGTWIGCGVRGVGDGAPRDSPWVPQRVVNRCYWST